MTSNQRRVQPGVPTGGQFAAAEHAEADVELSGDIDHDTAKDATPAGDILSASLAAVTRHDGEQRADEITRASLAAVADGRSGWDAANTASRAVGFIDSDTDEYRRGINLIAATQGMPSLPYPKDADAAALPGDAKRNEATAHAQAAHDSWERSDTDGFLSQHVSGLSSDKARLQGEIDDNGSRARFVALADLDGNLVAAKPISTRYGMAYGKLSDPDEPHSAFDGYINLSKASDPEKQRKYLADRGYREVYVMAPAYADFSAPSGARGMGGMLSVTTRAIRKDGGFSRDVEILPDEMRYF